MSMIWYLQHLRAIQQRAKRYGALDRALKHAELPHIRFHDLRHTAATLLLADDMNPTKVSELLGHTSVSITSVSITLDRYSHMMPSMQQDIAAAMDRLLGFADTDAEMREQRRGD